MLIMMIGLPGSGKSSIAEELKEKLGAILHSSDALRKELYGNEDTQDSNAELFNVLHSRIKEDLRNGETVIYDATNISYKRRKAFLQELKNINVRKIAYFVATPYEVCLERNALRDRVVPEEVIERMYKNFDVPHMYEGWDDIQIHIEDEYRTLYGSWKDFLFETYDMSQENPHHSLTLGEHCRKCYEELLSTNDKRLFIAGALHDCGKPFCKTYFTMKDELDNKAHYYGHEHVGSYNLFFYGLKFSNSELLDTSAIIRWHMQMWAIEKGMGDLEKYKSLWGDNLYSLIEALHIADKGAH